MHGFLELNETAPANSGARLDVTSAEAKSVKPSTVASGKDDNNKGDTPTVPTQPTKPDTPSTDDKTDNTTPDNTNNGNADSSTGDAATAPSTESGEGATTGDTARPVVYAVLAMMAAGLVLSVVVYDNKKKRI